MVKLFALLVLACITLPSLSMADEMDYRERVFHLRRQEAEREYSLFVPMQFIKKHNLVVSDTGDVQIAIAGGLFYLTDGEDNYYNYSECQVRYDAEMAKRKSMNLTGIKRVGYYEFDAYWGTISELMFSGKVNGKGEDVFFFVEAGVRELVNIKEWKKVDSE